VLNFGVGRVAAAGRGQTEPKTSTDAHFRGGRQRADETPKTSSHARFQGWMVVAIIED